MGYKHKDYSLLKTPQLNQGYIATQTHLDQTVAENLYLQDLPLPVRCYVHLYCGGRSVDWLAVRSPAFTVAKSALTSLHGGVGGELKTGEQ